jgi:hypothetical protein
LAMAAEVSWREWVRASGSTALLTGVSTVLMGTLPLLNGLFAGRLHLDWQQLGWLSTWAHSGTLGGTLLGFWLSGRGSSRIGIQAGAACALVAWLLTAFAGSLGQLVFYRMVTAVGIGCAFSIGTYLLARSEPQARSFSVMSGVQVVCGALHSALLPWLHSRFGYVSAVASLAFWFAVMLVLSRHVRSPQVGVVDRSSERRVSGSRYLGASLLLSVMTFQMAAATFWAYSERIAAASGLSEPEIATAISIGNLGGVPAALLGALAGERFGFVPILLLATIAAIAGEVVMAGASTGSTYLVGQIVFNFGWILGVSYYLALLAKRAHDATMVRSAPIALVIAGVLGPLPVALLESVSNTSGLLTFTVMLSLIALIPTVIRRG